MAGAITSPDLAIAASKVVRATRLLSENIADRAGYVPRLSPAVAAAFLRCYFFIRKSRWAAARPWSDLRRVFVQGLNSLGSIDLVPRIRGRHPQAAIEPCSSAAETTSKCWHRGRLDQVQLFDHTRPPEPPDAQIERH